MGAATHEQRVHDVVTPQVAATLAAAIVAYNTKNAADERLINEPVELRDRAPRGLRSSPILRDLRRSYHHRRKRLRPKHRR